MRRTVTEIHEAACRAVHHLFLVSPCLPCSLAQSPNSCAPLVLKQLQVQVDEVQVALGGGVVLEGSGGWERRLVGNITVRQAIARRHYASCKFVHCEVCVCVCVCVLTATCCDGTSPPLHLAPELCKELVAGD